MGRSVLAAGLPAFARRACRLRRGEGLRAFPSGASRLACWRSARSLWRAAAVSARKPRFLANRARPRRCCALPKRFSVLAAGATALSRSSQRLQTGPIRPPRPAEGRMQAPLFKPLVCKGSGPTQTRAAVALVPTGLVRLLSGLAVSLW